jgi:hypothetical protein
MSTNAPERPRSFPPPGSGKLPRIALFDERRRLWGFFAPEDAAMLSAHSAAEWYTLARELLKEQPEPRPRFMVIPFHNGAVRGKFYLNPWPEGAAPAQAPSHFSPEEEEKMLRDLETPGKTMTLEELLTKLGREGVSENGKS